MEEITATNYMTAAESKNKADGDVSLSLSRKTACIIVKIASFDDQYATGYSVSTVSVSDNSDGYAAGEVKEGIVTVSAYKATDFYTLLTPIEAVGEATFLTFTVVKDGTQSSETLTARPLRLKASPPAKQERATPTT